MDKRLTKSKSSKKKATYSEKLAIIRDWQDHDCKTAYILQKYKISKPTFYTWRKEFAEQAISLEPSPDVAVRRMNALAVRETTEINIATKRLGIINKAADLLNDRLDDPNKAKYFENKDLIAIIKLADIDPKANPQNQDDLLGEALKNFEKNHRDKMKAGAVDVETIKED